MKHKLHLRKPLMGLISTLAISHFVAVTAFAEDLSVRLDFSPWGIHAGMHLAEQKGWFKDAGLNVEIIDGKGTNNTIQLIGSGQGDVGQVQLGPMAVARERGIPIKSFAGWVRKSDLAVLVPADSNLKTVADLKGKKGVCFSASPWTPYIDQFLSNGGLRREDFDIAMVAPASMVGAYASGQADGLLTVAPFGLPLVATSRPARAILSADYGVSFPSYGLIAREETLVNKRDALSKLAQIQQRAWAYIFDGHIDEAVAAIAVARPEAKFSTDVLSGQIESYREFFVTERTKNKPYGWQSRDDWRDAIHTMVDAGLIKESRQPAEFFTNDLLRK